MLAALAFIMTSRSAHGDCTGTRFQRIARPIRCPMLVSPPEKETVQSRTELRVSATNAINISPAGSRCGHSDPWRWNFPSRTRVKFGTTLAGCAV